VLGDPSLVLSQQSTGLVVPASGRVIAVIGLDDVIVVDTPDGLLVASRERAQDVKAVVAELKDQGRPELT
jgi:mannose-1-phosphate guanylyltransferase